MIVAPNFAWLPVDACHRSTKIRLLTATQAEREAGLLDSSGYHRSVSEHLERAGEVFSVQFSVSQYRRASGSAIEVSQDLVAHASAVAEDLSGKITVSRGLLYALEDLWQCVVSDAHTDLHLYGGAPASARNDVFRNVGLFHLYDRNRYCDYSHLWSMDSWIASVSKKLRDELGADYAEVIERIGRSEFWFLGVSKMLSADPRRVRLGDFLADVSLNWIMAHEDAHVYCGHTAVFLKAGISPVELADADGNFLRLARERARPPLGGYPYPLVRTLSELFADTNACWRLVDTLFDRDTFMVYPILEEGVSELISHYAEEGVDVSEKEARFLVIARVCVTAAIGAVLLFQRHIEKKNIESDEYPDISARLANIVIETLMRINGRLKIPFDHSPRFFEWPSRRARMLLQLGLSTDIEVMTWNLFNHPALMRDPDFPPGKDIRLFKHLSKIAERSRQLKLIFESLEYVDLVRGFFTIPKLAAFLAMSDTAYEVNQLEKDYYDVFGQVFRTSQYTAFPGLTEKLNDTYRRLESQSRDQIVACAIASRIREEGVQGILGGLQSLE